MKVSIDSRTVEPGDIFIPVKGKNHDGRAFMEEAAKKGARVLDVDLTDYAKAYRKKLTCHVIAITGSAGKTTAKDQLSAILGTKYKVTKTLENQNNEVGVPLTVLSADYSTEILIVELAMRHKGEIAQLTRIVRPTHTVVTSIGLTHVELLKSQRQIAAAKAEVFMKRQKWEAENRFAFINFATPFHKLLHKKAVAAGYSILPFEGETKIDQTLNMCYTVGHHFGLTDAEIQAGLSNYKGSSHRLQLHRLREITVIDDAYNANPDGVVYALQYLKRQPGRKILVMGDMLELGTHSKQEHEKIGELALDAEVSIVYTFGEQSAVIQSDYHFRDRNQLHRSLVQELRAGDVVLVKGSRGMKMEETVNFLQSHYQ